MKNTSAAMFLKRIISVLCSMTKVKSMAIGDKTNALKARLVVLSLLKNKKFSLGSIPEKIHAILGQQDRKRGDEDDDQSKLSNAIIRYNASEPSSAKSTQMGGGDDDRDYYSYYYNDSNDRFELDSGHGNKYLELTQSLFKREDEDEDELDLGDPNGSVIDLVRNNKEARGGVNHEDFKLEDEINQVADLFILKFHKRMRLQKLESFKRYQEMLQRGT
ncbi:hypothetical protein RHGRI_034056 [Rhododendron griersonianum]|uniref:Uncharacterized protein n=4 Tax=Rhododendron griersonianum TaxID=479676 RepID=A0AAV6I4W3_9ERIC|nr:hypothetical protein RHGRI_034056 [Rhododendron griersonianum]